MFAQKKKSIFSGKFFAVFVIILFAAGYFINTTDNGKNPEDNLTADKIESEEVGPATQANSSAVTEYITDQTKLLMRINDQVTGSTKTQELLMPSELIGKSLEDAKTFLQAKYEGSIVKELNDEYALLYKVIEKVSTEANAAENPSFYEEESENSPTIANDNSYYLIKEDNGVISVYKSDDSGHLSLVKTTEISLDYLSSGDQELFKYGIKKNTMDEVNELLQDFES